MILRKQPKKPRKTKKQYKIQDVIYVSKALYDFHLECQYAKDRGYIKSFEVPDSLSKKSRYVTYNSILEESNIKLVIQLMLTGILLVSPP